MAKREIVLVLSMLVLIASCEGVNDYDYLQVVIQWQPSTCSALTTSSCYQAPDDKFSIHGMWPSLNSGTIPSCSGSAFDITKVNALEPGLSETWPNVVTGDNPWLWGHEWDKHGTCTEQYLFDQEGYFSYTIEIYVDYRVQDILRNNQILPNGGVYTLNQVHDAIKAKTGYKPAVRCNYNAWTGELQLHEVCLCFRQDNPDLSQDCPDNANTCNGNFVWYSWNTAKLVSTNK